jgi:hypothetical protein
LLRADNGDWEGANQSHTALAFLSALAVLVIVVSICQSGLGSNVRGLRINWNARLALLLVGANLALSFRCRYSMGIWAAQRFDVLNLVDIPTHWSDRSRLPHLSGTAIS